MSPNAPSRALQPGDHVPLFYGMTADRRFFSSEQQAGRPAAVILAGALPPGAVAELTQAFSQRADVFARAGADVLLAVSAASLQWVETTPPPGLKLVHCANELIFQQAGVGLEPAVLVIDRSQHVLVQFGCAPVVPLVDAVLACLGAIPEEAAREVAICAPVLMAPNLFDAGLRRDLISHFETSAHIEGAMASIDASGQTVNRIDPDKKRRRDCTLECADPLHPRVLEILSRRLAPEIKRAFQVDIAHVDRILIARYDDTGGYFRRHRDNAAPQVAFRQFALSVNLNTSDYEGGHLLFPEYTDHRYNPPAGAGIVFSASLLHEAAPVTRGSRYVLLTFLHDEAAELRRRQGQATAAAQAA